MIRKFENYMMKEHNGKDKAITSREIEAIFHCKGTKVREMVNELRCKGTPICSCGSGYYYSETAEDIHETITHLNGRVKRIRAAKDGMRMVLKEKEDGTQILNDDMIKRGDIFMANLNPIVGSEQGGDRPVLVVQNNIGNIHSQTVIVAIISSKVENKKLPTHVFIEKSVLPLDSVVCTEHIRTLDRTRLFRYVGKLTDEEMDKVDTALQISMGV